MVDIVTSGAAKTAADVREQIAREYGKYVAVEPITIDGVLAFGIGFSVPVSHIEQYPALLESGAVVERVDEPKANAKRSAWVAYAVTRGATGDEVAEGGLTVAQLREKYGTAEVAPSEG